MEMVCCRHFRFALKIISFLFSIFVARVTAERLPFTSMRWRKYFSFHLEENVLEWLFRGVFSSKKQFPLRNSLVNTLSLPLSPLKYVFAPPLKYVFTPPLKYVLARQTKIWRHRDLPLAALYSHHHIRISIIPNISTKNIVNLWTKKVAPIWLFRATLCRPPVSHDNLSPLRFTMRLQRVLDYQTLI